MRELVDEAADVDEVERAHTLLRDPCGLVEEREIRLDLARRTRALHLHRDAVAVRQHGAVHLSDRRRRDRRLLELEEEPLDLEPELGLDHGAGLCERERTNVVLELPQLCDDVGRNDVGARRQQLPELDERRPELVEHLAEARATGRRLRHVDPRPERQEVAQPVSLEEVAEPVTDRDLRDLGQPADVPRGRRHGISVTGALETAVERGLRNRRRRQVGLGQVVGRRRRRSRHRWTFGPLQQAQTVLELRDTQCELVVLAPSR